MTTASNTSAADNEVTADSYRVGDVLRAAGLYVARYGFHNPTHARDNYHPSPADKRHPAASDVGAIALVIYDRPVQMPEPDGSPRFIAFRQAVNAYVDWLELHYGDSCVEPDNSAELAVALVKAGARADLTTPRPKG